MRAAPAPLLIAWAAVCGLRERLDEWLCDYGGGDE